MRISKGWDDCDVEEKMERIRLGFITLGLGWFATTLYLLILIIRM